MSQASHKLALKSNDGSAWAWGTNTSGQLGDNSSTSRSSPVSVVGAHSFAQIAEGTSHSLALKSNNGSAWAWGNGGNGALGDNSTTASRSSPVSVVGGHSFNQIAGSFVFSLALKSNDGSAWAWGKNLSAQLGDNSTSDRSSPVSVVGGHSFTELTASLLYAYGIKADGSAWAWGGGGSGGAGGLGNNVGTDVRSSPVSVVGAHSFTHISAGYTHVLALKANNGSAWGWGVNSSGSIGDNSSSPRSSPVSVVGGHSFAQVSAGGDSSNSHSIALKANDGSAWAWGTNSSAQLGDNTTTASSSPVSVVGGHSFAKISAGAFNSYGLKADGSTWAWGARTSGVLGNNELNETASPVSVVGGHSFAQITASFTLAFALALKANDGSAWAWGANPSGQLGDNSSSSRSSPVSVVGGHSFAKIVGGGGGQSLALKSNDGSAWAWGTGSGRLGNNSTSDRSSPVSVVGGHSFDQISGGNHSIALKANDGSVWSWGTNTNGLLGDNSTSARSSPVSVVGGHSFAKIAAGNNHSIALKANDGSAWAWGSDALGSLGTNSNGVTRSSPVSVVGGHSFDQISAASGHSIALKANDGSAWAWGGGTTGRLGDNASSPRSSPVSVVGGHSFAQIAGGDLHSLALKGDNGSAWAWGAGTSGQLGNNGFSNRSSPVSVVGGHSFIKIAAGTTISYGLKADGSAWAWGLRTSGALGGNSSNVMASPIQVVQPTTAIKTILGLPYRKYIFNDITTGPIAVPSVKTVNGQEIFGSIKSINGNQ